MDVVAKTNWCELINVMIKLWHPMAKVFHKVDYYGLNLHQQSGSYHITSYQLPLISATSFFPNKSCMVTYFFMFLVYLPSGKAIVKLLLNPRLQLYQNRIFISRFQWLKFKVKFSMGWTANFMSVFLMIPNYFCNIQILVQVLHIKLGHAPLFFFWGDVLNHHDSLLVQSCNDTYMHTKQNVIDFNMLYPHRSHFKCVYFHVTTY
jgi:hypothetical protein